MDGFKRIFRRFYFFVRGQIAKLEARTFLKLGLILLSLLFLWYAADGVWGEAGLTRYGLLKDYKHLWSVVENEALQSGVSADLKSIDKLKTDYYWKIFFCIREKDFYGTCEELLEKLGRPSDVRLIGPGEYIYQAEKTLFSYPGGYNGYYRLKNIFGLHDAWFETFVDRKTMEMYTKYAAEGVGEKETQAAAEQITCNVLVPGKAAVIYIPSMSGRRMTSDRSKLFEIYDLLRDCENVAFCVTDDGGGAATYWRELIVRPNISGTISSVILSAYKSSELTGAYIVKTEDGEVFQGPAAQDRLAALGLGLLPGNFDRLYEEIVTITNEGAAALNGKIWLFIDGNTKYGAEGLASYCARTGFAELIGSQSGGEGYFGVGAVVETLPKSRFIINFLALRTLNPEGGADILAGTKPRIYLPDGQSIEEGFLAAMGMSDK